jgi:hypothetical protein
MGLGEVHVAGFAAIGAIVEPVDAQAHAGLGLAKAAVLLAGAPRLNQIALRADGYQLRASPGASLSAILE